MVLFCIHLQKRGLRRWILYKLLPFHTLHLQVVPSDGNSLSPTVLSGCVNGTSWAQPKLTGEKNWLATQPAWIGALCKATATTPMLPAFATAGRPTSWTALGLHTIFLMGEGKWTKEQISDSPMGPFPAALAAASFRAFCSSRCLCLKALSS